MQRAITENREVYDFLHSASKKYGIGFWKPGVGDHPPGGAGELRLPGRPHDRRRLPHPERRAASACWPSASGGADCGEVMAGLPWEVLAPEADRRAPHRQAVRAGARPRTSSRTSAGSSRSRAAPTRSSSTSVPAPSRSAPPARAPSATWARSSAPPPPLFPFDDRMAAYLEATDRARHRAARRRATARTSSPTRRSSGAPRTSTTRWSRSTSPTLEPHIVGPHSPDRDAAGLEARRRGEEGTAGRPASRRRSSARAPTPPTRTCGGPPTSRCRRSRPGSRRETPFLVTPGLRAHLPDDQARRHHGHLRADRAAPCSPTRAGRASASGSAPTSARTRPTPSSPRSTATSRAATTAARRRCRSSRARRS